MNCSQNGTGNVLKFTIIRNIIVGRILLWRYSHIAQNGDKVRNAGMRKNYKAIIWYGIGQKTSIELKDIIIGMKNKYEKSNISDL